MITNETLSAVESSDAELVSQCLSGNLDAFGRIVARYQTLICSLAYGATGSLSQSQDVSQETFVIAWKQLAGLREPGKLRSWLCGIARNRIYKALRQQQHEPAHAAESLDAVQEAPSREASPPEQTISREEEAILWRSLEQIPESYREPLILFYREHQSIERVAAALDLSEDAVKQRLSRGRKLLHEQVLAFVEGALERTSPGKTFTIGVLAALSATTTPAKAATLGAVVAKGGATLKGAASLGALAGWLPMLGGFYVTMRAQANDTKSPRERQFMLQMAGIRIATTVIALVVFFSVLKLDLFHQGPGRDIGIALLLFTASVVGTFIFDRSSHRQREIQMAEGTYEEAEWTLPRQGPDPVAKLFEGKSSGRVFNAVRFISISLVLIAVFADFAWKQHWGRTVLLLAGIASIAILKRRGHWYKPPRYPSLKMKGRWFFPAFTGLATLLIFNRHQYLAHTGLAAVGVASPAMMIGFNVVTVVAYAVFIAILKWRARHWKNV